jgi:hypothetical protein
VVIYITPETADRAYLVWKDLFENQGFYVLAYGNMASDVNQLTFLHVVVPVVQKYDFLTTYSQDSRIAGVFNAPTFAKLIHDESRQTFGSADSEKDFDPSALKQIKTLLITKRETQPQSCEGIICASEGLSDRLHRAAVDSM